jgi:hypothetical protein
MLVAALRLALAMAPAATATAPQVPEDPASARAAVEPLSVSRPSPSPGASIPSEGTSPARATTSAVAKTPEPYPRIAIGLFVSGGLIGATGLTFKVIGTSLAVSAAKEADRDATATARESDLPEDGDPFFGPSMDLLAIIVAAPLVTSSALLGSGMHVHGRWAAHRDHVERRPHVRRKANLMLGLGWSAIGLGIVSFATTRVTFPPPSATTHGRVTAIRELGWWTAIAGVFGGAGMAGYGVGYSIARDELDRRIQARIAPMLSRQLVGVGVSGRF